MEESMTAPARELASGENWLIKDKVFERPDVRDGTFDELVVLDGEECTVHAEMMSDKTLWIGLYPRGEKERRVVMWIHAEED